MSTKPKEQESLDSKDNTKTRKSCFVFGSNLRGIHGAGAAKHALENHGAVWGEGIGYHGNSYAIPTKDRHIRTLPLLDIEGYVIIFLMFARKHPEIIFNVTQVGCGLARYSKEDIAPMFRNCSPNVILPKPWGGSGFSW